MADRLDVLLGILLDKASQKDVERGLSAIEQKLGEMDDATLDKVTAEMQGLLDSIEGVQERFAKARQEAERFNTVSEKLTRNSAMLFVAGAAIVGGLALSAQNYVKFVEQAGIKGDATADRWVAASKRVQNAQLNLGQASAQVLLPIYEQAADLAEKAAAFVNENPDLVRAALNTGVVVATLGAVGLAVSKGIRLYADFKYLAATTEFALATANFQKSVREFLTGSFLGGKTPVGGGAGGALAGAGKAIGTITLLASAVIIGAEAGAALGNALGRLVYGENYKQQGLGDAALTATRIANTPLALLAIELEKMGGAAGQLGAFLRENVSAADQFAQKLLGVDQAAQDAENSLDAAGAGIRDFAKEATLAQATDAFIQYRQQEAEAERQYMAQRADIVAQGAAQLANLEANYMQQRQQMAEQFARSAALALANFQRQQQRAAEEFARQEAEALARYQEQRAQLLADFQLQERRAAEDHQKEMQRLAEDHNSRIKDLAASRDALGIVRENRAYAREKKRAEEDYRQERARAREDLQRRLQEMEAQFQQERIRRRADFERRQAEAAEEFARQQELARQQYEEQLKLLDERHKQELEATKRQTAERLRELDLQYREEQLRRRNAFLDIIRDLDASLLNEQQTRLNYYARMQADLLKFLEDTARAAQSGYGGGSTLPPYQSGGYTPDGAIRAHSGEFVLSRGTTNFLEGMIGGRLTQQGVAGLARGRSVQVSVGPITFDGRISAADRIEVQRLAEESASLGVLKALQEG